MQSDRFSRDIPLAPYAEQHGYRPIAGDSHEALAVLAHPQTGHTIGVSRDPRGHWRYDTIVRFAVTEEDDTPQARRERTDALRGVIEKGDITDFARHRHPTWTSGELRAHLTDELRATHLHAAERLPIPPPQPEPLTHDQRLQIETFVARAYTAPAARAYTPPARSAAYIDDYGVRRATLHDARFSGTCRENSTGGIAFVQRDTQGIAGLETYPPLHKAQLELAGITTPLAAHGAWHSVASRNDNRLVVAETPLSALSYHQIHHAECAHTRYLSAGLEPTPEKLALVDQAVASLPPGSSVVIAIGRDPAREPLAQRLTEIASSHAHVTVRRHAPDRALGHDWNDALRRLQRDLPHPAGPTKALTR
jgi:hypothetical protein